MDQFSSVETVLLLLVPVAGLTILAERLRVPYPIALVVGGLGLSFVPGLPTMRLDPEVVLLFMVPPLLYLAAYNTSVHELRRNVRPIFLLAFGLVGFTTLAVAAVAHRFIPGMTWPAAFTLGAIVSPPDAVAATAIFQRLGVPRRIVSVLEGESLVNDASALVVYRFAVAASVTGVFSMGTACVEFVKLLVGGVGFGLLVGWAATWARGRVQEPAISATFSLLTPFAAYLPAEKLGVSSVLAVVTAGLVVGWRGPQVIAPSARLPITATWDIVNYLLNGLIFILIGLQLPHVLRELSAFPWGTLLLYGAGVSALVILVRLVWVFSATYLPRLLIRRVRERDPYPPWQFPLVIGWAGMRGVVSLAAAFALPAGSMGESVGFRGRELIVFLTFCVILATLVVQGLSLPWVIRRIGVRADDLSEREEALARLRAANAALAFLDRTEADDARPFAPELTESLREEFRRERTAAEHLQPSGPGGSAEDHTAWHGHRRDARALRLATLAVERRTLLDLRRHGEIHDEVLHRLEHELDVEEERARRGGRIKEEG